MSSQIDVVVSMTFARSLGLFSRNSGSLSSWAPGADLLYPALFPKFKRFLAECEIHFKREYGHFRPTEGGGKR